MYKVILILDYFFLKYEGGSNWPPSPPPPPQKKNPQKPPPHKKVPSKSPALLGLSIHINIYLQSFLSVIYYSYHLFAITYKNIFYNWDNALNNWFICKISTRVNLFENDASCIYDLSDALFFFALNNCNIW